ncbi:Ypq2p [Sugiyamaella lignohabitans]|uniref:Ypq2p n=1 Tax=Sugiyamaella lignohabitans TaxID=796027 RepID=A0A167EQB5_9ASCO|nr:Ypq2p [Sugiyamaella lignohabitans]ANB14341.1 Ypq2p [Sugiyamaella lignohabitans]
MSGNTTSILSAFHTSGPTTMSCPLLDGEDHLIRWIYYLTGNCVYGNISAFSWVFGHISFIAWLGAQLPQVAENYINQSVDGLSWGFLLNWFIGDFTNLLGCLLTHQLPFQTLLGFYYVNIDIVLGLQYIYYSSREHRRQIILDGKDSSDEESTDAVISTGSEILAHQTSAPIAISKKTVRSLSSSGLKAMLTSSFISSFTKVRAAPISEVSNVLATGATVATRAWLDSESIGRMSAWICAALYVTSRMPQIYKNFRRKSTWGTSMLLFSAALTGNVTYTLSILLSPEARGAKGHAFLLNELPFLIGSAGTVCFDITILIQRMCYGNERPEFRDSDEHRHHHHQSHSRSSRSHPHPHSHTADSGSSTIAGLHSTTPAIHYRSSTHQQPLLEDYDDVNANDTTPLSMSLQTNYSG